MITIAIIWRKYDVKTVLMVKLFQQDRLITNLEKREFVVRQKIDVWIRLDWLG